MRKVIKKKSKIGMALNSPVSRCLPAMLAAETRRRCNAVLAQKFALANGKKTISMTPGGQLLQGMYGPQSLLTRQDADEIMKLASARFADGASGELNAFVAGAKADRIFLSLEEPILMSKGATVIKH